MQIYPPLQYRRRIVGVTATVYAGALLCVAVIDRAFSRGNIHFKEIERC